MTTPAVHRLVSRAGPVPFWLAPRLAQAFGLAEADRRFLEQAAEASAMGGSRPALEDAEEERAEFDVVQSFVRGLSDVGLDGDESDDVVRIRRLVGARV